MALRIVFMGTPDFSVPALDALVQAGHAIVSCYTQPPRPAGRRGLELKKSAIHEAAVRLGIDVKTPVSLKSEAAIGEFRALNSDVAIVVAYGLLLPKAILEAPKLGCYNGHASLLPRWRGAAPIQRAIMAGDKRTGMMVMKMEAGLDTGPVALETVVPISPDMTAGQLHDQLAVECSRLLVDALSKLETGDLPLRPQPEIGVTYAQKINKEETRIDWQRTAEVCHNHIRALAPFPGAWCEMGSGGKTGRVKVLQSQTETGNGTPGEVIDENLLIATGEGAIRLLSLQKAGSKVMNADEFLRGHAVPPGVVLT